MRKTSLLILFFILVTSACNLSVSPATPASTASPDGNTQIPGSPTALPIVTATVSVPVFDGTEISVEPLSIILSPQLASGAHGTQVPPAQGDTVAPWEVTPGHTILELEGYPLQGKFHTPTIYVYPADAYGELFPPAYESIRNLVNIQYNPGMPISNEQLPHVPFFNAAQIFSSNVQFISFRNGQGVRFLTEYAQYSAPVNNHELFYHFQGLTSDRAYYVVAILPVTVPVLAETDDVGAVIPPGGVAFPDINDPNADWHGYYASVEFLLNNTAPEAFNPTINQLDLLIQSILIAP